MTYESEVLADSPEGYWRLQETSGTTFVDNSGNAWDLTVTGTAHTLDQPGPLDSAIAFSTASGYIHGPSTNAITRPTVSTYEVWVYLTEYPAADTEILGLTPFSGGSGATQALDVKSTGHLRFMRYGGGAGGTQYLTAPDPLPLNEWHHIITSVGAAGSKIRLNMTTVATDGNTGTAALGDPVVPFIRGGNFGASGTGAMVVAEPAVYLTQLSDTRTDAHYAAAIAATPTAALNLTAPVATGSFEAAVQTVTGAFDVTAAAATGALGLGNAHHFDTTNAVNLRQRTMRCGVEITVPVAPIPAGVSEAERHDAIIAYPLPTLVDGRPT